MTGSGRPNTHYKLQGLVQKEQDPNRISRSSDDGDGTKDIGESKGQLSSISPSNETSLSEQALKVSNQAMFRLIEAVFDLLQMCAYEINQATKGSELELTWERPAPDKERWQSLMHDNFVTPIISARISTRHFTLIVKGNPLHIEIYILPVEQLLGFNARTVVYPPYGKLTARPLGTGVGWYFEEILLEREHVTLIAKHLMETLMRCARHQEFDLNGFRNILLAMGSLDAQERETQKRYREQFFAKLRKSLAMLPSSVSETTQKESHSVENSQIVPSQTKTTQKDIEPSSSAGDQPAVDWNLVKVVDQEQRHSTREVLDRSMTPESTSKPNRSISDNNGKPDYEKHGGETKAKIDEQNRALRAVSNTASTSINRVASPMTLPRALQMLLQSVDLELEAVSQAGAQAFNARDLTRTQAILELTNKLSDFRQAAKQLYDEYQGDC
jgi:hypothetical protein